MAGEHLILTDEAAENEQDAMLSALTTIAYATPKSALDADDVPTPKAQVKKKKVVPKGSPSKILYLNPDKPSRFIFKIDPSFAQELTAAKKQMKPKRMTHTDKDTVARTKQYATELPPTLAANILSVREFFLSEIAPLTLGAVGGTSQAKDVAQRLLNTEVRNEPFAQFERMVDAAAQIKMAKYIAKYLKLPATYWKEIRDVLNPKQSGQKEVMFFGNPGPNGHPTAPASAPADPTPRPSRRPNSRLRQRGST